MTEPQDLINVLARQRDNAMNMLAQAEALVLALQRRIEQGQQVPAAPEQVDDYADQMTASLAEEAT